MTRRIVAFLLLAAVAGAAGRVEIVWPTPNPAWADGRALGDYLQHAGSGEPESGTFGGVRDGGSRFHEGIDIRSIARDRRGEPTDTVLAAMAGIVRHLNANAGDGGYGRYVVLEHPDVTPAVYTLYAHLARITPGLREGERVTRGQALGTMGHSAGGYAIPRDRAHLHFEIGVMVTRDFPAWYAAQKFGSANDHALWNGMNLMGLDPLDFLNQWRARKVDTFQDFFKKMETAVRVRIATRRVPDFVQRYPSLVTKPLPLIIAGWELRCNWTGLPFALTPLTPQEAIGLTPNVPSLVEINQPLLKRQRSRSLVVTRRGANVPGKDLDIVLKQLFGPR